jgi:hypothetical protein
MLIKTLATTFARGLAGPAWGDQAGLARAAGLEDDGWQGRVYRRSASGAPQQILNCSRQSGKTTTTAVLALHRALTQAGSTSLVVSPSQRQSAELVRKVRDLMNRLRVIDVAQESVLSVTLTNGARVVALPASETTIRCYAADLVLVDEAARVPDATIDAVRPMVSVTRGQLLMLSTPHGQRGRFWQAWAEGGSDWERTEVDAYSCPRISREWLEQERRTLPPLVFESEYLCRFSDVAAQVFTTADVLAAITDEVEPLWPAGRPAA